MNNTADSMAFETINDAVHESTQNSRQAFSRVSDFATRVPYATLGAAALSLRSTYRAATWAASLPGQAVDSTLDAPRQALRAIGNLPERLAEAFGRSEHEGRLAVERVSGREALTTAKTRLRSAKAQAKSTKTSVTRAASASKAAVESVAEAIVDPRDTRAYEERTREELYDLACEREVTGRSAMNKAELIGALRNSR